MDKMQLVLTSKDGNYYISDGCQFAELNTWEFF